ncbi:MAG: hypothetical protein KDA96_14670 [Planctomycetaceae bacterium]|nr:hypothetical protein [Planctomycetaceae bacterium]
MAIISGIVLALVFGVPLNDENGPSKADSTPDAEAARVVSALTLFVEPLASNPSGTRVFRTFARFQKPGLTPVQGEFKNEASHRNEVVEIGIQWLEDVLGATEPGCEWVVESLGRLRDPEQAELPVFRMVLRKQYEDAPTDHDAQIDIVGREVVSATFDIQRIAPLHLTKRPIYSRPAACRALAGALKTKLDVDDIQLAYRTTVIELDGKGQICLVPFWTYGESPVQVNALNGTLQLDD